MDAERLYLDPARMRCARLRRTVKAAAQWLDWEAELVAQALGQKPFRKTFITLTYRNLGEWKPGHISRFVRLMRQWFRRRESVCRFVWVAELQKRGALHYHVLVLVPRRMRLPAPDSCGWWPHGMTKIETARSPVGYMVKYASKITPGGVQKMPKGVRIHGNGGAGEWARMFIRAATRPKWLADTGTAIGIIGMTPEALDEFGIASGTSYLKKCKGGFVDLISGEVIQTPWEVKTDEIGGRYIVRKEVVG